MRTLATYGMAALLLSAAQSAFGQPAPTPAPTVNPDEAGENNPRAAVQKKRGNCRQEGMGQGLRGPDLLDHVAVCVQEARLACLKQAIAQKIRGPERVSFISKCLGS
jgi:hypothetical protein